MANPANKFLIACIGLCLATPALANDLFIPNQPYYDDMSRSDSIALNAGDATQSNITIHAEEVWPSYVNDTHIHTDGVAGELVIKKLKARHSPAPPPPPPSITINAGPIPAAP